MIEGTGRHEREHITNLTSIEVSNPFAVRAGGGERPVQPAPVTRAGVHVAGMEHDTPVLRRETFATGDALGGGADGATSSL